MAIDLYNRPRADRSLEAFVVHMMMAWLHARTARPPVIYVAVRVCEGHPGISSRNRMFAAIREAAAAMVEKTPITNDMYAHVLPHRKAELTKATSQRRCL
jgi:hypothetical protein